MLLCMFAEDWGKTGAEDTGKTEIPAAGATL